MFCYPTEAILIQRSVFHFFLDNCENWTMLFRWEFSNKLFTNDSVIVRNPLYESKFMRMKKKNSTV